MRIITSKLKEKYSVMQWQIQTGNITIVNKVKIDMKLSEFRATKIDTTRVHNYVHCHCFVITAVKTIS